MRLAVVVVVLVLVVGWFVDCWLVGGSVDGGSEYSSHFFFLARLRKPGVFVPLLLLLGIHKLGNTRALNSESFIPPPSQIAFAFPRQQAGRCLLANEAKE